MSTHPLPQAHIWYTPAWCAEHLGGIRHGDTWQAKCPVHGGDSLTSLGIAQGKDKHGNPMTLLHCFAHQCAIEDICAAMGIEVRNLFCMAPEYQRVMRHFPPAKSPRIARLKAMAEPTPDEIAQILLEEMIVSDPEWIETCAPVRQKMWELAQASHAARNAFHRALAQVHVHPRSFFEALRDEMKDGHE